MTRRLAAILLVAAIATPAGAQEVPAETPEVSVAPDAPAATSGAEVGYKRGFFIRSADGVNSLTIQGRVQTRFSYEEPDSGTEETQFEIARARLTLKGHALDKNLQFKFQSDFGKGNVVLKDFYVDYEIGETPAIVRAGQWKRPFSRQQINSSGNLELVDRAITDKGFGAGRDIGVAVHDNYEKSPEIEWVIGVFNGTGEKPVFSGEADPMTGEVTGGFSNVPDHLQPAVVARAGYNPNGIDGYSEADFTGGPLRWGVGASVLAALDSDDDDAKATLAEADFVAKVDGISTTGGFYYMHTDVGGTTADTQGFHLQGGYLLDGKYQPAVRVAMMLPEGDDNNVTEITGGVSVYQFEHGFKWQTDVSALMSEQAGADSTTDVRVRSQLQLAW